MKNFIKEHPFVALFGIYSAGKAIHDIFYYADRITEDFLYHKSYRKYLDSFGPEMAGKPDRDWERRKKAKEEQGLVEPEDEEDEDSSIVREVKPVKHTYLYNNHWEPKIIKAEEFGKVSGFETEDVLYYEDNNEFIVIDGIGDEFVLDALDIEAFFGDCLTKYDWVSSDMDRIYIRNFNRETDFEVCRIKGVHREQTT